MTAVSRPSLSIIIPMYNRAALIARALESCLRQSMMDWEAVVVDDGSTDGSAEVVQNCRDPRVRLVRLADNRGQCLARNAGAQEARADWLLFLDSDDELAPGALELVRATCESAAPDVGKIFYCCRWDDGTISPDPPFPSESLDYTGYLRWLEAMTDRPTEAITAVRRERFLEVPYCAHRSEGLHNLDFAGRFTAVGRPEVIRLYHQDAQNRLMGTTTSPKRLLAEASGHAAHADAVLERHGPALRRWAPTVYAAYLRSGGLSHALAGRRLRGFAMAASA